LFLVPCLPAGRNSQQPDKPNFEVRFSIYFFKKIKMFHVSCFMFHE
jgi:hypothetical protein